MKYTAAAVLALAATATAQNNNQTGPFNLRVTGKENTTIDGYIFSCHAGAAIEGMCYGSATNSDSYNYYFNYSAASTQPAVGTLSWYLPVTINDTVERVSSPMSLSYNPTSNVAVPLFTPGYQSTQVGFDDAGKLFLPSYYDDSTFQEGVYPNATGSKANYQWAVCYTYVGSYYYRAVTWIAGSLPAHNPTCQAVDITKVAITA